MNFSTDKEKYVAKNNLSRDRNFVKGFFYRPGWFVVSYEMIDYSHN